MSQLDPLDPQLLSTAKASRQYLGQHPKTTIRHVLHGRRVGATTIRLDAIKVGGQWYTTPDAIRDYLRRVTEAELALHEHASKVPSAGNQEALVDLDAETELNRQGI
jgi:hypothetical protein